MLMGTVKRKAGREKGIITVTMKKKCCTMLMGTVRRKAGREKSIIELL